MKIMKCLPESAEPIIPAASQSVLFRVIYEGNALAGRLKQVSPEALNLGMTAEIFVKIRKQLAVRRNKFGV